MLTIRCTLRQETESPFGNNSSTPWRRLPALIVQRDGRGTTGQCGEAAFGDEFVK